MINEPIKEYRLCHDLDKEKHRKIGKQLFLINILRHETYMASSGENLSFSRDRLANLASMSEEELDRFIDSCIILDRIKMEAGVASELAFKEMFKHEKNAYRFILHTLFVYGKKVVSDTDLYELPEICKTEAEKNYRIYNDAIGEYRVSDLFARGDVLESILVHYIRSFVALVSEKLDNGYDIDVINAMIGFSLSRERLYVLKDFISKEAVEYGQRT